MGEKCLDNIDAVFDLNRMIRDSSVAQFILAQKPFGRENSVFSCSTVFSFQDSYGRNCSLQNECILNVYIKVYMRCLYQCWFVKKYFGGKQLTILPPWLHPVCDVATELSTGRRFWGRPGPNPIFQARTRPEPES